MKQNIKISLILIVMQVISTLAAPQSNIETVAPSANQPGKDKTLYYFQKKAEEYDTQITLLIVSMEIKAVESYIGFLETHQQNDNKRQQRDLKKILESLEGTLEIVKKDKQNCILYQNMLRMVEEFRYLIKSDDVDDELKNAWKKLRDDTFSQIQATETMYTEINDQLPEIIEQFLTGLDGDDKGKYKQAFGQHHNKYKVLYSYYEDKLGFDDNDFYGDSCKNFENTQLLKFLDRLMDIWRDRYQQQLLTPYLHQDTINTSANQTGKDITYDFFQKKGEESQQKYLLLLGSMEIKAIESYIAFLENQQQDGDEKYDSQDYQYLKKTLESLKGTMENVKNDKLDCILYRNTDKLLLEIMNILMFVDVGVDLKNTWQKLIDENNAVQDNATETMYQEMNDLLPETIDRFLQGLEGEEKKDYKTAFDWYVSKYSVFHSHYKHKFNIADDDVSCINYAKKQVVSFLDMLATMWRMKYQKAK